MITLLRIEARHNLTPLLLPLLAVLLGITPLARDLTPVALWLDRSADVEGSIQLIGPFAAGAGAWAASREHRRRMTDLLASTPRDPWLRAASAWLVSLAWMAGFYLALCAVFLSVTATQATWGGPDLWPAVAGLFALVMCSAVGFTLGLCFTTRFITPLAAVGVLAVILGVRSATVSDQMAGIGLLSPVYPGFGLDAGVFYAPQPDLSMLKIVCDLGVTALALGVPAWRLRAGRPALRRAGAVLLAAGIVLTGTAGGLDATARSDGHGIIVPAFRAAADHAVPYVPVCRRAALTVCVHPAYDGGQELAALAAIIGRIASPVAGVPGMPVRAVQSPAARTSVGGVQGNPPVLAFQPFIMHGSSMQPPAFETFFEEFVALSLFVAPGSPIQHATPAQRACALYLLRQAGDTASPSLIPPAAAVSAAADRLAALRPAARDAWLTAHLAALRAGSITTEDIP